MPRHNPIDRFAYGSSPLHSVNPYLKLAVTVLLLSAVSFSNFPWPVYALAFIFLVGVLKASGVPISFTLRRVLIILPFGILVFISKAISGDFTASLTMLVIFKALCSICIALSFVLTTPLHSLLRTTSLSAAGLVVFLIYRYFFLVLDVLERTFLAIKARGEVRGRWRMLSSSRVALSVLQRVSTRAERVEKAMLMRGVDHGISRS